MFQFNLLYIQRTPDICDFLGLKLPNPAGDNGGNSAITTTTTSKPNTTSKPSYPTEDNNKHPAERTGSIGSKYLIVVFVWNNF